MGCKCSNIYPDEDMRRWESQCSSYIVDADNYYTKVETDKRIDEAISGITSGCCITPEEVESAITSAMTIVEGEIPSLSGYATEEWVENKNYLTEHQPIKTINGVSLIGTGDIEIGTGGTIDLSNYYTTAETQSAITSAITEVEGDLTAHTSNTQIHVTSEEKNTWNSKANVWCGSEVEWSQISGSTSANTIYLVY